MSHHSRWDGRSTTAADSHTTIYPRLVSFVQFVGMVTWALVVSGPHQALAAHGWVLFVSITLWILTIVLFFLILFGILQKLPALPWALVVGAHTV